MLDPLLIVYSRSCRFNRFPSKDIPYGVVTPTLQSGEVEVCIFNGKGTGMEVHRVSVEEVQRDMRGLVRIAGVLSISSHIDAPKGDLSSMIISEVAILDRKSQRHDVELTVSRVAISNYSAGRVQRRVRDSECETFCQVHLLCFSLNSAADHHQGLSKAGLSATIMKAFENSAK